MPKFGEYKQGPCPDRRNGYWWKRLAGCLKGSYSMVFIDDSKIKNSQLNFIKTKFQKNRNQQAL